MAALLVLVIVAGCAAFQYFKGTFLRAFVMLITAVAANIVAFSYFEPLANVLINRENIPLWAQSFAFLLLFVATFAVLLIPAVLLTRKAVDLGTVPEQAGRIVLGLVIGLVVSGTFLTALALAPLSNTVPYRRFDTRLQNIDSPKKSLLNTDGLTTGLFGIISRGTLSGKKSFAALHPDFLNQVFLNRHPDPDKVPLITTPDALQVPAKAAVWPAPDGLTDQSARPVSSIAGHTLMFVRVGFPTRALKHASPFTISQLRAVCKPADDKRPLAGKGLALHPAGYLRTINSIQTAQPDDTIKLTRADIKTSPRWIDFAFQVPDNFEPVLLEFKANAIVQLPPAVAADQTPQPQPFIAAASCTSYLAKLPAAKSAKLYGLELAAGDKFLADLDLPVADQNDFQNVQTSRSTMPAQFDNGKITCTKAELKIPKPAEQNEQNGDDARENQNLPEMLKPADKYTLLSLKCNNPDTGSAITGTKLPVLEDISGILHWPVGIIASAQADDATIYQLDFCSLTDAAIQIDDSGAVAAPFVDSVWLTAQAQTISQFYLIYMVKPDTTIVSVRPPAQSAITFENTAGFLVN